MKSLEEVKKMLTTPGPEGKELGSWILHCIQNQWYRVKVKGDLELGFTLVRVRAWVH